MSNSAPAQTPDFGSAPATTLVVATVSQGFFRPYNGVGRSVPIVRAGLPPYVVEAAVRVADAPCGALLVPDDVTRIGFRLLYAQHPGTALGSPYTDPDNVTVRFSVDPEQPGLVETRAVYLRSAAFHSFDFEIPPWPVLYADLQFAVAPPGFYGVEFTSVSPKT